MSTKIRLARAGTTKRPFYRIVVTSSRSPRDGDFIEKIGTYNPLLNDADGKRVVLDAERAKYWLSVGALPSSRVHLFMNKLGIVDTKPAQRAHRKPRAEAAPAADAAAAAPAEAAAPAAEGAAA